MSLMALRGSLSRLSTRNILSCRTCSTRSLQSLQRRKSYREHLLCHQPLLWAVHRTAAHSVAQTSQCLSTLPCATVKSSFDAYITLEELHSGLADGTIKQGALHVALNSRYAFVNTGGIKRDMIIKTDRNRNRAFDGDMVAVRLLSQNTKGSNLEEGEVVHIVKRNHPRVVTGLLTPYNEEYAFMQSRDSRVPNIRIPLKECPEAFVLRPQDFNDTLFVVKVDDWLDENSIHPLGSIKRSLGQVGEINAEMESILVENSVDSSPFSAEVLACLPDASSWSIPAAEVSSRTDLREDLLFTIDPVTARDIDDAISCRRVNDDEFEVGVHIADVSHFVHEGSSVDTEARSRATSVYIPDRVIHMLPESLSQELCSLNPAVDRLAFSVKWHLRADGSIMSTWFGRTLVRSCAKLAYEHAQEIIDADAFEDLEEGTFPGVSGGHQLSDIHTSLKHLSAITRSLRCARVDGGSLFLDNAKLAFSLDDVTGQPNGVRGEERPESSYLIEELMLLANKSVAARILEAHPEHAILRWHPPPKQDLVQTLHSLCHIYDVPFSTSSTKQITDSFNRLEAEGWKDMRASLMLMFTKTNQLAQYFCAGTQNDDTSEMAHHHYALNFPIYTHFTSPIRRYADVMVHRLLTSALEDPVMPPTDSTEELQSQADLCNDKKLAARVVQDASIELFFQHYLKETGPMTERGVVVGVSRSALDVYIPVLDIGKKIEFNKNECNFVDSWKEGKCVAILEWMNSKDSTEQLEVQNVMSMDLITSMNQTFGDLQEYLPGGGDVEASKESETLTQYLSLFEPVAVVLSAAATGSKFNAKVRSPFERDVPLAGLDGMDVVIEETSQKMILTEVEVSFPKSYVGEFIGHKGANISLLREITSCNIRIGPDNETDDMQTIFLYGTDAECKHAQERINNFLAEKFILLEVSIPNSSVGEFIGLKGENIKSLIKETNCTIDLGTENESENVRNVLISGTAASCKRAQELITKFVEGLDYVEVSIPNSSVGAFFGLKGKNINSLIKTTNCTIQLGAENKSEDSRNVLLSGTEASKKHAQALINKFIASRSDKQQEEFGLKEPTKETISSSGMEDTIVKRLRHLKQSLATQPEDVGAEFDVDDYSENSTSTIENTSNIPQLFTKNAQNFIEKMQKRNKLVGGYVYAPEDDGTVLCIVTIGTHSASGRGSSENAAARNAADRLLSSILRDAF